MGGAAAATAASELRRLRTAETAEARDKLLKASESESVSRAGGRGRARADGRAGARAGFRVGAGGGHPDFRLNEAGEGEGERERETARDILLSYNKNSEMAISDILHALAAKLNNLS